MNWFRRLVQPRQNKANCQSDPVVPARHEESDEQPLTRALSGVVWPPDNVSSDAKVFWIAVSKGSEWCPTFLETQRSRLVALFVTTESAIAVRDALVKLSLVDVEAVGIRCATGSISRPEFEKVILKNMPPSSKRYRLVWEDDRLFIGLCCLLKINVFIKPSFSSENLQQCVSEIL